MAIERPCQMTLPDEGEFLTLFSACFQEDPYYADLFPDPRQRKQRLSEMVRASFRHCVEQGGALAIREDGQLVAFLLTLDYWDVRRNFPALFQDIFGGLKGGGLACPELHERLEQLNRPIRYLLSMGVAEDSRGRGLAGRLVDAVLERWKDEYAAGDISNPASLPLYTSRSFEPTPLPGSENYFLMIRDGWACQEHTRVALPDEALLAECGGEGLPLTPVTLPDCRVEETGTQARFVATPGQSAQGVWAELSRHQLLRLQRFLNLCDQEERTVPLPQGGDCLYYIEEEPAQAPRLWNSKLRSMVTNRQGEWNAIPDVQILIPIQYDDAARLAQAQCPADPAVAQLLRLWGMRTQ